MQNILKSLFSLIERIFNRQTRYILEIHAHLDKGMHFEKLHSIRTCIGHTQFLNSFDAFRRLNPAYWCQWRQNALEFVEKTFLFLDFEVIETNNVFSLIA